MSFVEEDTLTGEGWSEIKTRIATLRLLVQPAMRPAAEKIAWRLDRLLSFVAHNQGVGWEELPVTPGDLSAFPDEDVPCPRT